MLAGSPVASQFVNVMGFDHVVLAVSDVEAVLDWYTHTLGLEPVRVEEWRSGAAPFPSVRVNPTTIIDLILRSADGPGQLGRIRRAHRTQRPWAAVRRPGDRDLDLRP
jgi:catechol 2,3-dioxygenase-like lactoylglutathione lyase family enzyme